MDEARYASAPLSPAESAGVSIAYGVRRRLRHRRRPPRRTDSGRRHHRRAGLRTRRPLPGAHAVFSRTSPPAGLWSANTRPAVLPSRLRFLARNRIIATLARGTVVIEAAVRSGTLATARHASDLARPLMAVPGPVTSATSAGCNALIREQRAACFTGSADIIPFTLS